MELEEIIKAVENDKNSHILNLTTVKNHKIKINILSELSLTKTEIIYYMKKLKTYRYIDQMDELKQGGFIRWIDIREPNNISLSNVAIFCEFKITDSGVSIVYKNFQGKKQYEFKMEEALIFEKLNYQEEILMKIMDKL
jgi:predicted transcriptional regulator